MESVQCMFRIPRNSGRVLWEITNRCNYACKYCIFSSGCGSKKSELTLKECKKVIDDLWNHDFKYLKITGGEPFIRNDLIELLKYAVALGMKVDVSTNASLITKEKAKEFRNITLEMVHVSLDGDIKEIHEQVRGKNTYDRTVEGIKNLKESNQYIRIGTVLYKGNQDIILKIIEKAKELEVSEIIFSVMEPVGRMDGDKSFVITKSLKEIEEEIEFYQKKYVDSIKINYNWSKKIDEHIEACPAGNKFIYINDKGNIAPCSWLVTKSSSYLTKRTLKNHTLEELFQDSNWREFLQKQKCGECIGKHPY